MVERLHVKARTFAMSGRGEVGAIELEQEARGVDRVVLLLHLVRECPDVFLVAGVVDVREVAGDDSRRRCGHERIVDVDLGDRRLQIGDVCQRLLEAAVVHRPVAGGSFDLRAPLSLDALVELRKVVPAAPGLRLGGAAESVHPLLDVRRIADLARLAVVDDGDAGLDLPANDLLDGVGDASIEAVDRLTAVAADEQVGEIGRPRQAAGVGGRDATR
jgi:hypothetical protein